MVNWKTLFKPDDIVGQNILLRESYPMSNNITYYAGIMDRIGNDQYQILTPCGKIVLYPDDYIYHFIFIDEILF